MRAKIQRVPLMTLVQRGLQSHSPFEKDAIFTLLAPYVILDDVAERGWEQIRGALSITLPVLNDILANELPTVGQLSLRAWFSNCITKCQELRKQDVANAGDLCIVCLYVAITARRVAVRPTATITF